MGEHSNDPAHLLDQGRSHDDRVRRRLVCRLRQHLRDLLGRTPVALRSPDDVGLDRDSVRGGILLADSALVTVPGEPTDQQQASLLAASDVLGTGREWNRFVTVWRIRSRVDCSPCHADLHVGVTSRPASA